MTLAKVEAALAPHALTILGGFYASPDDGLPKDTQTLLLVGPRQPMFWREFSGDAEWQDGRPDPMDRWSRRVIGRIACDLGAKALFPFGGPPHHPFYSWALRTGRSWPSPVQFLVSGEAGLWVSFRGALALKQRLDLPSPADSPCQTCHGRPCLTACPVQALTSAGYDLPRCHAFLDTQAGQDCMTRGCAVRRACPASAGHARMPEQSAYHMRQFHK